MSYFHGRQGRGAARTRKEVLREEAEARNALTPEHRRKAFLYGPVTLNGVRTPGFISRYESQFIEDNSATPRAVREHAERMTSEA